MNNIFIKNLMALASKNSNLAQKLQKYIPNEVPQLVQEDGGYNIFYKEKYIHNRTNPLAEAQEIFSLAENTPVAIHLIYGLGLGYLFQFASLNSKGTVILYEPDLNILWLAFSLVDFSNDILKKNVFILDSYDEIAKIIYEHSGMKNTPQLLSLPSQRGFDEQSFDELVLKLKNLVGSYFLDLKYTKQKLYPNLVSLIGNLSYLIKEKPLHYFKDVYKGKTAVVVSAGPTLDRNIETLKKNRDKYVLFVVGTAVKTLYSNGIKPDFIVIIETYNSTRQLEGLDLEDVNFITEPYSHSALRGFNFKQVYSHISANTPVNHFWSEISGVDIEEYWSKGTVSYTALNCARLLGCSKIILVGQDLAYIEGQCYSKESAYKDLICGINPENGRWEIMAKDFEKFANAISPLESAEKRAEVAKRRLGNLNTSLYLVKGINGDMLPTESVYAAFVQPLVEYTEHFNDREYINTSLVGAQIDGFKNMSLEEALADSSVVGEIKLSTLFEYDTKQIVTNICNKLDELSEALNIITEMKVLIKNLNNDIKRYKTINEIILKTLKKVSVQYLNLSSDFTNKSKMFDYITIANRVDLDYEMKMTQEFTVETVTNILEKISQYIEIAEKRVNNVNIYTKRIIDENFNTKG